MIKRNQMAVAIIERFFRSLELDFSAKVRWRMKFDRNPLFVTLQDKHAVKEYARINGVKTAQLLYVTDRPETIPFAELPENYFIKANHSCGWNILCYDSRLYLFLNGRDYVIHDDSFFNMNSLTHNKLTQSETIQLCREWLDRTYSKKEWAYQRISPRIIVEELLTSEDKKELKDYRMYTFDGVVKAINVGSGLFRNNGENVFFDPNWQEFKLTSYREKLPEPLPVKPASLKEMIEVAQCMGKEIDFARIDLYCTIQGVILGEITVYPEGGILDSPTSCPVFNKWLGHQWKLKRRDTFNASLWNIPYAFGAPVIRRHRRRNQGRKNGSDNV